MTIPINPPLEWFSPPADGIPIDKRITIDENGRAFGYVALWDTCHTGLPGCVTAPRGSESEYAFAHQGETLTAEGTLIATANVGGGAGHAPLDAVNPNEFYEKTSTQMLRARYGEDEYGLWFAGALWPDVSELEVAHIRASPVSGDWRVLGSWRQAGGKHEFMGSCFVNVPGFPLGAGSVANTAGDQQPIQHIAASALGAAVGENTNGNLVAIYKEKEMCDCQKEKPSCACGNETVTASPETEVKVDPIDALTTRLSAAEETIAQMNARELAKTLSE